MRQQPVFLAAVAFLLMIPAVSQAVVQGHWDHDFRVPLQPRYSQVFVLGQYQGDLIVGGSFDGVGGLTSNGIIRFDGSSWHSMGQGAENRLPWRNPDAAFVEAMIEHDGKLIVAGQFDHMDGQPIRGIAAWDGENWTSLAGGTEGRVLSLSIFRGRLVAAGLFSFMDGIWMEGGIAEWTGTAWKPLGAVGDLGTIGAILTLGRWGNNMIIGGPFTRVQNSPMRHIAEWDGDTWSPLSSGLSGNSGVVAVESLGLFRGDLFVGGHFTVSGVIPNQGLARWGADRRWHSVPGDMAGPDVVMAVLDMEVYRDHLFAGGSFTSIDGESYQHIGQFDGNKWTPLGLGVDNWVRTMEVYGDVLYVGGDFAQVEDAPLSSALSRWVPEPVPVRMSSMTATRDRHGRSTVRWQIAGAGASFHVHRQPQRHGAQPDPASLQRLTGEPLAPGTEFAFVDGTVPASAVEYWLEELAEDGSYFHGPIRLSAVAAQFFLRDAAPNPLRHSSSLAYAMPRAAHVRITVHDVRGRVVATLVDGVQPGGAHTASWNGASDLGKPVAAGAYLVRMAAEGVLRTRKITVVR